MICDQITFDRACGELLDRNLDPSHLMEAIQEDDTIADRQGYARLWDEFAHGAAYRSWQRRCAVVKSLKAAIAGSEDSAHG